MTPWCSAPTCTSPSKIAYFLWMSTDLYIAKQDGLFPVVFDIVVFHISPCHVILFRVLQNDYEVFGIGLYTALNSRVIISFESKVSLYVGLEVHTRRG